MPDGGCRCPVPVQRRVLREGGVPGRRRAGRPVGGRPGGRGPGECRGRQAVIVPFSKRPRWRPSGQDRHVPGRIPPPPGLGTIVQPALQDPAGHRVGRPAGKGPQLSADEGLAPAAVVPAPPAVVHRVAEPSPLPAQRDPLDPDHAVHGAGRGRGAVADDPALEVLAPPLPVGRDRALGGGVAEGPARAPGAAPGGAGRAGDRPRTRGLGPVDRPAAVVDVAAAAVADRPLRPERGAEVGAVGAQLVVPA